MAKLDFLGRECVECCNNFFLICCSQSWVKWNADDFSMNLLSDGQFQCFPFFISLLMMHRNGVVNHAANLVFLQIILEFLPLICSQNKQVPHMLFAVLGKFRNSQICVILNVLVVVFCNGGAGIILLVNPIYFDVKNGCLYFI